MPWIPTPEPARIPHDHPQIHAIVSILYGLTIDVADHGAHDDDLFSCKAICWCGDDGCPTCGNDRPNCEIKPLRLRFWWPKHPGSNSGIHSDAVLTPEIVRAAARLVAPVVRNYDRERSQYLDDIEEAAK